MGALLNQNIHIKSVAKTAKKVWALGSPSYNTAGIVAGEVCGHHPLNQPSDNQKRLDGCQTGSSVRNGHIQKTPQKSGVLTKTSLETKKENQKSMISSKKMEFLSGK